MSETAITTIAGTVVQFSPDKVDIIRRTIAKGATDEELAFFLLVCERLVLDPFARQIHFVRRGKDFGIQTGIDGYRLIADRTGAYCGNDDYRFDENIDEYTHIKLKRGDPVTASATVYKMVGGQRCPFTATARWDEYHPGKGQDFMWRKMPYLMLGKCAEALALRKAFPSQLDGIYTDEITRKLEEVAEVAEVVHDDESATPAEIADRLQGANPAPTVPPKSEPPANPGDEKIAPAAVASLYKAIREAKWGAISFDRLLLNGYGHTDVKDVRISQFNDLMKDVKNSALHSEIRTAVAEDRKKEIAARKESGGAP